MSINRMYYGTKMIFSFLEKDSNDEENNQNGSNQDGITDVGEDNQNTTDK